VDISNRLISLFQTTEFMQADVLKTINEKLDIWVTKSYYPVTETHEMINSCCSQGSISVNVLFYKDQIVINSYFHAFKVISIKFNRIENKITKLILGRLLVENSQDVEQLLSKIREIALMPNKTID